MVTMAASLKSWWTSTVVNQMLKQFVFNAGPSYFQIFGGVSSGPLGPPVIFISYSFFWSSDFTTLYLLFVALVHPPASVNWNSKFYVFSFNSSNQSACFLVGLMRTSDAAVQSAFFKAPHCSSLVPVGNVEMFSLIADKNLSFSLWLLSYSMFSLFGGFHQFFFKGGGFGLMLHLVRIMK